MSLEESIWVFMIPWAFCFNPYFVGDESGSNSGKRMQRALAQVSILILLEMSLEEHIRAFIIE